MLIHSITYEFLCRYTAPRIVDYTYKRYWEHLAAKKICIVVTTQGSDLFDWHFLRLHARHIEKYSAFCLINITDSSFVSTMN